LGIKLSIKMVGPYMQAADLQIIPAVQAQGGGRHLQGAAAETDSYLAGVLSALPQPRS